MEVVLKANSVRLANKPYLLQGSALQEECRQDFQRFWRRHEAREQPDGRPRPLRGRNAIVRSVCPQVYGMLAVKLAILLTIIGGVEAAEVRQEGNEMRDGLCVPR